MRTYQTSHQEESFLDTIRETVYSALPHYDLVLRNTDGSTTPYQTSPLETIAVFMSKGKNHGTKNHNGHQHQAPKMITVKTGSGVRQIERDAHIGSGMSLTDYLCKTLRISRLHARKSIQDSQ